jgi:hypothetical protein
MKSNKELQNYFNTITTVDQFLEAEKNGFSVDFITYIPEMPGASFFHEACRCCHIDLIKFLFTNRQIDINMLDEDGCTPLGYVVNSDVYSEAWAGNAIATVNLGCENPKRIKETILYLTSIGCKASYCDVDYTPEYIFSYLELISSSDKN